MRKKERKRKRKNLTNQFFDFQFTFYRWFCFVENSLLCFNNRFVCLTKKGSWIF